MVKIVNNLSTRYVPPEGKLSAKLMLVGEAPGKQEALELRPFVGRSGNLLNTYLRKADTARELVWLTNLIKHVLPDNRKPFWNEILEARRELLQEIELLSPKAILTMGNEALRGVLGREKTDSIARMRSKIIFFKGIRVYASYAPATVLTTPSLSQLLQLDIQRSNKWVTQQT